MTQTDFTGKNLGGYHILRKLGQGGMAVVYKAHEESLNRVVALKVIAQHLAEQPQFIERFRREAQAAAQLSHPNIVQIYAIGEDQGVHYFSMEYVKGRSLADIIEKEGFLTPGRALPIIAQAAEALAVAHDAGIVHRDIKPANIMIDAAGRVRVADFGIAQMSSATRMTQSGMLVGTPEYISPEQCQGEKLDGRSDIYALGVTLYQMLSGRTPFDADTPAALVLQIVQGRRPAVGELNPTVPASVQGLVERMMHVDRAQRFQSAEDLVHAIRQCDTQPATSPATTPATTPATGRAVAAGAAAAAAMGPTEAMPSTTPGGGHAVSTEALSTTIASASAAPPTEVVPPAAHAQAATQAASPARPPATTPATRGSGKLLLAAVAVVWVLLALAYIGWSMMPDADTADDPGGAVASAGNSATTNASGGAFRAENNGSGAAVNAGAPDAGASGARAGEGSETGAAAVVPPQSGASSTPTNPASQGANTPGGATQGGSSATQGGAQPPAGSTAPVPVEQPPATMPPPINSIIAETSGEYEYVDLVNTWVESAFGGQSFQVVDFVSSPYGSLAEAARFHVVTTAKLIDTRQLEYYGRTQTQFTVALTMRATDLADGVTVAGPVETTVQYTSVNMRQNLEKGTSDLARRLAQELRRRIQ